MYVEFFELGQVRGFRTAVVLAEGQVYEPDMLFVAREREEIIAERGIQGAPDLVIVVLSASTAAQDRGVKFRTYQQAGVRELWLIDPYGPAGTEFFQLEVGQFRPVMPNAEGVIHSVSLPNFKLNTAWLWPAKKFVPIREALKAMGVA